MSEIIVSTIVVHNNLLTTSINFNNCTHYNSILDKY